MAAARRLRIWGLALLLLAALLPFACAESSGSSSSPKEEKATTHEEVVGEEKKREVRRILANPPASFHSLMAALPFSIYEKDKTGNYVAFCDSNAINWEVVGETQSAELSDYIKYVALFFWTNVDKRADSSLKVVVDASGFSMRKVVNGSVKTVLVALVSGLNATVPFVGQRPGSVFLINAPSFLSPLVTMASKLAKSKVDFRALNGRAEWQPALIEAIGEEHLPEAFGGSNPIKLEDAAVMRYMKEYVRRIAKQKRALKSKM
ncbi:hypothetical protein Efla_003459 [Eimeria flavescens]